MSPCQRSKRGFLYTGSQAYPFPLNGKRSNAIKRYYALRMNESRTRVRFAYAFCACNELKPNRDSRGTQPCSVLEALLELAIGVALRFLDIIQLVCSHEQDATSSYTNFSFHLSLPRPQQHLLHVIPCCYVTRQPLSFGTYLASSYLETLRAKWRAEAGARESLRSHLHLY